MVKTKARLVAKSSSQVQDVDYFLTFALAPSSAPTKLLLAVDDRKNIFLLKVSQALVRANSDTGIYMKLPGGWSDVLGMIMRLNRSRQGLKQSGQQWDKFR